MEFLVYEFAVIILISLLIWTDRWFHYSTIALWGVSIWGLLHMAGGGIKIGNDVLYGLVLVPISSPAFGILRYDQVIHAFCYFIVTFVMYSILITYVKPTNKNKAIVIGLSVLASIGTGSINEIVEFLITVFVPNNGVGDYINNSLDLVFNFTGALIAGIIIKLNN